MKKLKHEAQYSYELFLFHSAFILALNKVFASRKMIEQYNIRLPEFSRGFHLITGFVLEPIKRMPEKGLLHVFIKHTSAGLTINENADPTVRMDFESAFNHLVRENEPYYKHDLEGSDDMPAHIKSSLVGASVTIPIANGKPDLGTWQGIYLCEFRNRGGRRELTVTLYF